MRKEMLRIENVTVEEEEVTCLQHFNMHIFAGEIMGLMALDSHGVKTLIRMLTDNIPLKYGRVYYRDTLVNTYRKDAKGYNRIYIIGGKTTLVEDLTVSDNIFVLRRGFRKYVIDRKVLGQQVEERMKELGIYIRPDDLVAHLTVFERCVVEMVRAVMAGAGLIVLFRISEILSNKELDKFFEFIRQYAQQGVAFLYIGNHHEEIFRIADRFSIMEDGRIVKVIFKEEMGKADLEPLFETFHEFSPPKKEQNQILLSFDHVRTENLRDFHCQISKGQCVAILDRSNTILEDLRQALEQGDNYKGNIFFCGKPLVPGKNMGIITDNPVKKMLFPGMSYMDNFCFSIDKDAQVFYKRKRVMESIYKEFRDELGEVMKSPSIQTLDKGSLYDLIYYREILLKHKLVVIMHPFTGADMYLRLRISRLIQRLKDSGVTILLLTINMTDVLAVSDRLRVVEDGCLLEEHSNAENELIQENYYGEEFSSRSGTNA
ncbi:MAG: sugar ABC transporter ATP-binding protein [Eubacteriales bacterium]|nr:sugar ABC transporter ATP-binding protein [Eubacteriales bacterium]